MTSTYQERVEACLDLEELICKFKELLEQADCLVRVLDDRTTMIPDRADSMVFAHIRCALDRDHSYLDRSSNLQDIVNQFREHYNIA